MHVPHAAKRLRWTAITAVAVASLVATAVTAAADAAGSAAVPVVLDNPDWGNALPPAGAETSRAYDLIVEDNSSGYTPRAGECSKEVHARYWSYGPDDKVYPTWHPTRDPSGCTFGHEHGDDPRQSELFGTADWPAFGYTSEVLMGSAPGGSHRHEDHVGHKVLAVNNLNVIEGDDGTSFFPPQGNTRAVCDVLLKFHQGTHSPDAFTNNAHELIFNQRCQSNSNGQTFEARFSALIPSGRPGGFGSTDCPGGIGERFTEVGPSVPPDGPSDTTSLGRLITGPDCAQAIRDGVLRFDPISGGFVPLDTYQLHEFWFATVSVNGAGVNFGLSPLFYVLNPSRYYDPSKPNDIGRQVELCSDPQIIGDYCDQVRQLGGNVPWDDPRSPFKGSLREYRVGSFTQSSGGATTVYTDVYGRNASTTPFDGSIEQYFSGNSGSGMYVRGATKDWAANNDNVHSPN